MIIRKAYGPLPINLRFFDSGEKTEKPTQKKKTKARKEGQVAKSQEIGTAFLFLSVFFVLRIFAPFMLTKLLTIFTYCISLTANADGFYDFYNLRRFGLILFMNAALVVLPIVATSMAVGLVTNIAQVGWKPTMKPIKPKFNKLNPLKGFKRMFSTRSLMELVKSLVKLGVIGLVIYNVLNKQKGAIFSLLHMSLLEAVGYIANVIVDMAINVGVFYLFIGAADYAFQRYKHGKELKMSKHEVKEEYKQVEGNPQIKGRIRQRMREASMRRMMQAVPTADVIITNPTHFSVAVKYDRQSGAAPVVVAKGQDYTALRIKELARESDVMIVENPPLARTLYATVDIGREIPPELYQAVAEILAYVYKLKNIA